MRERRAPSPEVAARVAWPLALTRAGLLAERLSRAFLPFWTVTLFALSAIAFGLHETLEPITAWAVAAAALVAILATLAWGARRFRWPSRAEAIDRLDRTLAGRPLAALSDALAIGSGDRDSEAVWRAHLARMAARASGARAVAPDLRVSSRDPFGLRYLALTLAVVGALFGSLWRVATVGEALSGGAGAALAAGPAWEGWIEPPHYTGRPSLYLADLPDSSIELPVGSRVTIRLYGEAGALSVAESVSAAPIAPAEAGTAGATGQSFEIAKAGRIAIEGEGGRAWEVAIIADAPPAVEPVGEVERAAGGEMRRRFRASDDYGVVRGRAEIALDLGAVDRRFGLAAEPEPREVLTYDLPMTISGDRRDFVELLVEDASKHPWAGLPVTLTLVVEDQPGQTGAAEAEQVQLPGRRFFDPLAASLIEARRDLLWTRENLPRTLQVLRAVTHRPDEIFRDEGAYLQLRVAMRRMESELAAGTFTAEARDEAAEVLWNIALLIEEGDLADALERLRRAQDRLSEAMRNGASDDEIAELMQELREAMRDYMRQLAENAEPMEGEQFSENSQEITGDQLQQMLDEIQRLMEEGRMAEAQALLDQLMQMLQNMQVARGQGGGEPSPGQQAMEGLAETLRDQQELSDDSFQDLQQQFGDGQQGQQQGQMGEGQDGRQGQSGRGQQQGMGQGEGEGMQGEGDGPDARSLAERQRALRRELDRQTQNLPGAGTPEGDAARDSLGRAGEAMERAEDALRNDDLAGALDDQAEAMEALREGMRNLGEALAQERQQPGQQGQALGEGDPLGRRDPLGRELSNGGRVGTDENLLQGDDIYRRADELLDEIRRRSGEQERPESERDYLERLLDRF